MPAARAPKNGDAMIRALGERAAAAQAAQAKLAAHEDAQREREIAALESIAKSLEALARLGTNR